MKQDIGWWLLGLGVGTIAVLALGVFLGLWIIGKAVRRGFGKGLNL